MPKESKNETRKLPKTAFAAGNDFRFEPGVSGNPSGRSSGSKRRLISRALHQQLGHRAPDKVSLRLGLTVGSSWAQCISMSLIFAAIRGDVSAAREIRDAVGDVAKSHSPFDGPVGGQQAIVVQFVRAESSVPKQDDSTVIEGGALSDGSP